MSRVAVVGAAAGASPAEATSAVRPAMTSVFICIGFLPVVRACEIISPHPEERRFLAARLEGWPRAQQCLLPSFETAAQERGLLRMRAFIFSHALSRAMTRRRCNYFPRCPQSASLSLVSARVRSAAAIEPACSTARSAREGPRQKLRRACLRRPADELFREEG